MYMYVYIVWAFFYTYQMLNENDSAILHETLEIEMQQHTENSSFLFFLRRVKT